MLQRDPKSHKGQNGRVAIIGGSHRFHGAPIFSALAAEASGVDLMFPVVHRCHEGVTRMASFNFIVHTFKENSLTPADAERILSLLEHVDACVIGPGMAETPENVEAISRIVFGAHCTLILDAAALHPSVLGSLTKEHTVILTPHQGELARLVQRDLQDLPRKEVTSLVELLSGEHRATVLLKGAEDFIAWAGEKRIVRGGNAGLTKGGTGDALTGLIAGLVAQRIDPFEACVLGTTIIKKAGAQLFKKKGYAYTTWEVIGLIPELLR
ncbi:NAD(P)H-hydrate dehydratase [Candidatus Peregrinibacteria bacterium]|nr:NAD(P)H-hydrate dehydratase [Candidatus Peregrinibacteria bacterium]